MQDIKKLLQKQSPRGYLIPIGGNRITAQQHGALTLMKTDHLLLGPGGYNPAQPVEQRNYLQQKQEQQLTNIDLHAVNQGIDLLNKYYPGFRTSNLPTGTATATNQPTYSKTMGKLLKMTSFQILMYK